MINFTRFLFVIGFGCAIVLAGPTQVSAAEDEISSLQSEKLGAFARTYGYVRYFHPSDQASLLDWNQMALFGAGEALNSPEDETTEKLLERIFGSVVVDLEIYRGAEKPRPQTKKVASSEIVAWQHSGVGMGQMALYRSARTNRASEEKVKAATVANVLQATDANELRGKEIRFQFQAKVDRKPCGLQGWFRVDRESEEKGLSEDMRDRPVTSTEWAEYEISGTVDNDAELLTFGVMMMGGSGSGLIDNAKLEFKDGDEWTEVEIRNPNFEEGDSTVDGWIGTAEGYDYVAETIDVAEGEKAMRIAPQTKTRAASSGFLDAVPELGEVVDAEIGNGLRVRMPLGLPISHNYEAGESDKVDAFVEQVASYETDKDNVTATAGVAITWSTFQHFYPYFDQVETDWDSALVTSMKSAAVAEDRAAATRSLKWLVAQLHDGHGNLIDPKEYRGMKYLPLAFGWVEDQLVVLASGEESIKVGDVVLQYDGVESKERIEQDEKLISGSPQWKRFRSTSGLSQVLAGGGAVALKFKRGDKEWESTVEPGALPPSLNKRPVIDEIEAGEENGSGTVYYVDLGRAEPTDVDPMIEKFANAKGIVFDMRGYPRGTQYLFQHMTDQHLQSAKWLVPEQVRPDRVDMVNFNGRGRWQMAPREPRFKGKFAFITNGSAISYAESCMAIIANYELAPIVGSPTAGANGNINPFNLPGGYRVIYTGMRVLNHDDSQHHVIGVKPTVPMEPTAQGIRDGRDELLEKAIELVK